MTFDEIKAAEKWASDHWDQADEGTLRELINAYCAGHHAALSAQAAQPVAEFDSFLRDVTIICRQPNDGPLFFTRGKSLDVYARLYNYTILPTEQYKALLAASQPVSSPTKATLEALMSNHGNAEDLYVAHGEHLNCPHCGGSGHIDDVSSPTTGGWQPIETAPVDVLLLLSDVDFASTDGKPPIKVGGYWDWRWHVIGASWKPTHWMPLPPAPQGKED